MFGLRLRRYRVTQSLECICHAGLEARRTAIKRSWGSSRAISHCNITGITGDKLGRYSHTALIR